MINSLPHAILKQNLQITNWGKDINNDTTNSLYLTNRHVQNKSHTTIRDTRVAEILQDVGISGCILLCIKNSVNEQEERNEFIRYDFAQVAIHFNSYKWGWK